MIRTKAEYEDQLQQLRAKYITSADTAMREYMDKAQAITDRYSETLKACEAEKDIAWDEYNATIQPEQDAYYNMLHEAMRVYGDSVTRY